MHGLNRPIARPLAPVAPRRPRFSVHHGVELVDEYAWLRAGNWQEVMRDPGALDPGIRTYLEAENAFAHAAMAPRKSCSTATRRPRARPTGSWAPPSTAPTTGCWPTPSTTRAPNS